MNAKPWLPQLQIALRLHRESSIIKQCKSRSAQYILQNKHDTQSIPTDIYDLCFRFYYTKGLPLSHDLIVKIFSDIQEKNYPDLDDINFELYEAEFPMVKEILSRIKGHINRGHKFSNLDDEYLYDMTVIGYLDLYSAYECKQKGNEALMNKDEDLALNYYANMGMHLGDDVENNELYIDAKYLKFEQDAIHGLKLTAFTNSADAYLRKEEYSKAIKASSMVLGFDEDNIAALILRGIAYRKTERFRIACKDLMGAFICSFGKDLNSNVGQFIAKELLLLTRDAEKNLKDQEWIQNLIRACEQGLNAPVY